MWRNVPWSQKPRVTMSNCTKIQGIRPQNIQKDIRFDLADDPI